MYDLGRIVLIRPYAPFCLIVSHACYPSVLRSIEQLVQQALPLLQEQLRDLVALRLLVADGADTLFREAQDPRLGHAQQDGRVRGDDELRPLQRHAVDMEHQGQLPLGRQRRLRFVHQIHALPGLILQKGQKALPVELGVVIRQASVVIVLQIGDRCDIEETLCTEEVARVPLAIPVDQADGFLQL